MKVHQLEFCFERRGGNGWAAPSIVPRPLESVVPAKSWLLTTGWKRHGLIGLEDVPKAKPSPKHEQR